METDLNQCYLQSWVPVFTRNNIIGTGVQLCGIFTRKGFLNITFCSFEAIGFFCLNQHLTLEIPVGHNRFTINFEQCNF